MLLHRSDSRLVRRPLAALATVAGLLVAVGQATAAPAPQPDSLGDPVASRADGLTIRADGITIRAGAIVRRDADDRDLRRADRALFTWTGRVDREVLIVVRGREVRTRGFDADLPNRARVNAALPRTRGTVLARLNDGRGDVDVIEQPSPRNGYQAVLRVRDPRGGADSYRITVYWDDRDGFNDRGADRRGNGGGWGRGGRRNDDRYDDWYDNRRRDD